MLPWTWRQWIFRTNPSKHFVPSRRLSSIRELLQRNRQLETIVLVSTKLKLNFSFTVKFNLNENHTHFDKDDRQRTTNDTELVLRSSQKPNDSSTETKQQIELNHAAESIDRRSICTCSTHETRCQWLYCTNVDCSATNATMRQANQVFWLAHNDFDQPPRQWCRLSSGTQWPNEFPWNSIPTNSPDNVCRYECVMKMKCYFHVIK